MRLRSRPMQPKDVKTCAGLIASDPEERRRYGNLAEQFPLGLMKLLRAGSLNSTVVEDKEPEVPQAVAFGASVFASNDLLSRLKAQPLVWLGAELTSCALRQDNGILTPDAIRKANSNEGLNVVVWVGIARPPAPEDQSALYLELMRAFSEDHLGYKLNEIIAQPIDLDWTRMSLNAGMLLWDASRVRYLEERSIPDSEKFLEPFLLGASREFALRDLGNRPSMLFSYTPPKYFFRPAEQRLLLAALQGLTDDELADDLGVSLSAVKKTWRLVYERAPAIASKYSSYASREEPKRGKEKKQRLLAYLREHMEELRPVLPPSGRGARAARRFV